MAANRKHNGWQNGRQAHAEGQHGERSHEGFIDGRHGRHGGSEESEGSPQDHSDVNVYGIPRSGRHRLREPREQHDEADKNSEAGRLAKDMEREHRPIDGPSLKGGKRPGQRR